jgi:hypothetical protein
MAMRGVFPRDFVVVATIAAVRPSMAHIMRGLMPAFLSNLLLLASAIALGFLWLDDQIPTEVATIALAVALAIALAFRALLRSSVSSGLALVPVAGGGFIVWGFYEGDRATMARLLAPLAQLAVMLFGFWIIVRGLRSSRSASKRREREQ